jgi:hypothetical protein
MRGASLVAVDEEDRVKEEHHQLLLWYTVVDTLFGQNFKKEDAGKAFELAAVCKHPYAVRMAKLVAGQEVRKREEARQVFLECDRDPLAVCFGALLGTRVHVDNLRQSAESGFVYAQAKLAFELGFTQ